ncbi:MAG: hypothetical protein PVJ49_19785, partial [Acidobacteriota bacterium]
LGAAGAGAGASGVNIVTRATEAYVRNNSDARAIGAAGLMVIEAHDRLRVTADVNAVSIALTPGVAVAVGIARAENTIISTTRASVENSTVESKGGDLLIDADSVQLSSDDATPDDGVVDTRANAEGVSVGLISGAVVGARAVESVSSTVEAFASGSTLLAKDYLKIDADSEHDVTPYVFGFAASTGVSISAAEAIGKVSGATRAYVDGTSTITVGDDADITADSIASATPEGESIAVGVLGAGVGVAEFKAEITRETSAFVGTRARVPRVFNPAAAVDTMEDTIEVGVNDWATGDAVVYDNNADNQGVASNIGNLSSGATYYVIDAGDGLIRLASSHANALAGTYIALTSLGTGGDHMLTPTTDVSTSLVNVGSKQVNVKANATLTATADNFVGGFGLAAGAGISKSTATVYGATLAYVGEGAQVNAGGVLVEAYSADTAIAKNRLVSVAGGVGVKDARADATISSRTEAFVGALSGKVADTTAMGINVGTAGTILVDADSTMTATAESKGGGFAVGASLSFFKPTAIVQGATRAYVRDGVDIDAGTLTVRAGFYDEDAMAADRVVYSATATAFAVDISFGATVQDLEGVAIVTGVTEAFLGASRDTVGGGNSSADIVISDTDSPLTVSAFSDIDAVANVDGGGASLVVTVNAYKPRAEAGGATRAFANDGVKLFGPDPMMAGPDLKLKADGDARADADLFSLGLSVGAAVGILKPVASLYNDVEAYVGRSLDATTSDRADITLTGAANVDAVGKSVAEATATGVAIAALVGVNDVNAEARLAGKTRAYIGKNTTLGATSVDLNASEMTAQARAQIDGGSGGLIAAANSLEPIAIASRETGALVGDDAVVTLTGGLTAIARTETGTALADASISAGSGSGGVAVNILKSTAIVGDGDTDGDGTNDDLDITGFTLAPSSTRAAIGNDATVSATFITLDAKSNTSAASTVTSGAGAGLVAGNATTINANSSHDTEATIGDRSTVTATNGAVQLLANGTTAATPTAASGAGAGLASFNVTKIKTVVSSDTTAAIGGGGTVTADSVTLDATATHTSIGTAKAAAGAGVVNVGSLDSRAEDKGSANVRIGTAGDATGATITTDTAAGINADAKLTSMVNSQATAFGIALVGDIAVIKTTALNEGKATGYLGDNVNITASNGGSFDMLVDFDGWAVGTASAAGGAIVEVKDSTADVDFKARSELTTGTGGSIHADGNVNLGAELNFDQTAGTDGAFRTAAQGYGAIGDADNAGGGGVSVQTGNVDVDANSVLNVDVGTGLSLTSDG